MRKFFISLIIMFQILFSASSQEPIEDILLNNDFYEDIDDGSYDCKYLDFIKNENDDLYYYLWLGDIVGETLISKGPVQLKNGKFIIVDEKKKRELSLSILYDDLFDQYQLSDSSGKNNFFSGTAENGTKSIFNSIKCTRQASIISCKKDFLLYKEPDKKKDLFYSNVLFVYKDYYYMYPNCCRVHPDEAIYVLATKDSQEVVNGEKGRWYLIDKLSNYYCIFDISQAENYFRYGRHDDYAWLFLPEGSYSIVGINNQNDSESNVVSQIFIDSILIHGAKAWGNDIIASYHDLRGWQNLIFWFQDEFQWPSVSRKTGTLQMMKNYLVVENLRLRDSPTIDSKVITSLQKGTYIKLIDLGDQDIIDNEYSKWVKVEIISGNDKTGNKIKPGTIGWCFGAYLK